MLILSRKKNQDVKVILDKETLEKLLQRVTDTDQPEEVHMRVIGVTIKSVRCGFTAHEVIKIVRGELDDFGSTRKEEQRKLAGPTALVHGS